MTLWVARDSSKGFNGRLYLYEREPRRDSTGYDGKPAGFWVGGDKIELPTHLHPELTWNDKPLKIVVNL